MTRRTLTIAALVALLASCGASTPTAPSISLRNVETIRGWDQGGGDYLITTGCHGSNRVYLRVNSIAAVGNDPTCAIDPIR